MEQPDKKLEVSKAPQQCQPLQCPLLGASQGPQEDEINLMDLWRVIWPRRWMIVGITTCFALVAIVFSLMIPNSFRADVQLAAVGSGEGKSSFSSALGGLGGLAAMAGISMPSSGNVEENLAVLKSREFLLKFVEDKNLLPVLFADQWDAKAKKWQDPDTEKQPNNWDAYRLLNNEIVTVSQDKNTALITLSVEWTDAKLAADWGNELVERLNQYLRQQAIERSRNNLGYLNDALVTTRIEDMRQTLYTLIAEEQKQAMLANTQKEFALRVLDQAVPPDKKSKPKRKVIVVVATLIGGFFAVFLVFVLNFIKSQKLKAL